jgi:hypothetical protein
LVGKATLVLTAISAPLRYMFNIKKPCKNSLRQDEGNRNVLSSSEEQCNEPTLSETSWTTIGKMILKNGPSIILNHLVMTLFYSYLLWRLESEIIEQINEKQNITNLEKQAEI